MSSNANFRVMAIDDEPHALRVLEQYVKKLPEISWIEPSTDAIEGIERLKAAKPDLLLLDIQMPDISGLDLARALTEPPLIIFTTAFRQFAFEGFELNAIDYLLKPISFPRFQKAIEKARDYAAFLQQRELAEDQSLLIYVSYELVKIPLREILYIESVEDYIRVHRLNEKPVLSLITLKSIEEKLPPENFQRIHRSFIVNTKRIRSIRNKKLELDSGDILPVSQSHADFIRHWKKSQ